MYVPLSEVQKISNGTYGNSSQLTPQNRYDMYTNTSNNQPPPVSPRPRARVRPRMVSV